MPVITKYVHVRHPETAETITFAPGDERPEWAKDLITNPDVLGEFNEPDPEPETVEAVDTEEASSDETPETVTRSDLEARAKKLKIRFNAETTDAELEALIEAKE